MAEARVKDEWRRTSALMALIANCHRDPKKTKAFRPADFDPFRKPDKPIPVGIGILKDVFIDGKVPPCVAAGR
ncbi:MAG: hypothetical protein HZB38_04480 [Planctomycetes bacterium]|nr:hypothetical protein [Planctomycetota bacterium]